jgi:hypothetical protein
MARSIFKAQVLPILNRLRCHEPAMQAFRKEKSMSNTREDDRVLNRLGARILDLKELEEVTGGINTGLCTFNPKTHSYDGDCTPEPN